MQLFSNDPETRKEHMYSGKYLPVSAFVHAIFLLHLGLKKKKKKRGQDKRKRTSPIILVPIESVH